MATFVVFAWRDRSDGEMPAAEVARLDGENRRARAEQLSQSEAAR